MIAKKYIHVIVRSERVETRFKDLIIDCEDGEKTKNIYIEHCSTCGESFNVRLK